MKYALSILFLAVAGCNSLAAQVIRGDAARGEQLLRDHGCVVCHQVNRQGGHLAPDLGRRISRDYTPGSLTAVIWNHAPSIWTRTGSQTAGVPPFSEAQAADLFAYFSSRRYFERLGDAERGKRVFAAKRCAECHGISKPVLADANPVVAWRSLRDPIALAQATWNRPQLMLRAFARKGIDCPRITPQELTDLMIYLENLPGTRGRYPLFYLASPQTGQALFETKGCAGCHHGRLSLENRMSRLTPVEVAAALWNHVPGSLETHPPLSYEEMTGIISYLWSIDARGDPSRGKHLYAKKKCAGCHDEPGILGNGPEPLLAGDRQVVSASIVTALWSHGTSMQAEMSRRGQAWPRFTGSEMADLSAYLVTRRSSVSSR